MSRTGERMRRRPGFTLIEIMVAIAIMAVLMGIGATFIVRFTGGLELESEKAKVVSFLLLARDTATATGRNASLVFTSEDGRTSMTCSGVGVVDSYHMEDTAGAYGNSFTVSGTPEYLPGIVGRALRLENTETADFGESPRWDLAEGFFVEFYLSVESVTDPAVPCRLLEKDGQFRLWADPAGAGCLSLRLEDTSAAVSINSPYTLFEFNRWIRIGIGWDGTTGMIFMDGVSAASGSISLAPASGGALHLFGGANGCGGMVDEVSIARWGMLGTHALGRNFTIKDLNDLPDSKVVTFAPDGTLANGVGEVVTLLYKAGTPRAKSIDITIGYTGTVTKE